MPVETAATFDTTALIIGLVIAIASYLIGSLSSAVIYCKLAKLPDPRQTGSGNPGATNMLRIADKKAAILVLLGDLLKGAIPVWLAAIFLPGYIGLGLAAIFTMLGHLYPVFFDFQGGKGVATAGGICLAISEPFGLAVIAIWILVALTTRLSSLSALAASGAAPILAYVMVNWQTALLMFIMSALVFYKHRDNIKRLRDGTEPKMGKR